MQHKSDHHAHESENHAEYRKEKFENIHNATDGIITVIAESHLTIKDRKLLLIEVMQKFQKEILIKI